ncbi:MAG: 23S rRNA (adenine(2503)-C(2))-methyltransferase RlmN [Bacteroidales bacterium]|nr:23S rRNA (adenine(2503)-C(2))-methyltransferase RlmN [Candidatus Cacconaster merdequi]
MKEPLLGKTLDELKEVAATVGLPGFAATQMAQWLYRKGVSDIDMMTNIPLRGRAALKERYEVGITRPAASFTSSDGTRKYLFPTKAEGKYIEAVMIPDDDRATLCVSSQVGCKMGCKFCMTGRGGFHGHLTADEIISQFLAIDEAASLTNTVFMGMGEPLDNWDNVSKALVILTSDWGFAWSPKRITLSTIGVLPNLVKYLDESRCHLAVSLHNPFPEERETLMPVQKAYDIREVVSLLRQYDFTGQRRVSFEYTMFAGVNDTKRHADALVKLLRGLECRINLIRFHAIPDSPLKTSSPQTIESFKQRLNNAGITTTLRASRGEDIMAACGLLAGKGLKR